MKSRVPSENEAMKKYYSSVKRARGVGGKPISKSLARSNMGYGASKDNISNISEFGSIVFSPPYCGVIRGNKEGPMATSTPTGWKSKKVRIDEG